jgi:hypothetical protein
MDISSDIFLDLAINVPAPSVRIILVPISSKQLHYILVAELSVQGKVV